MRGCADRRSAGKKALVTATTANTLVSYVRRKLSTSASGAALPSTMMPALLTRMSRSSILPAAADLPDRALPPFAVAGTDIDSHPGGRQLPGDLPSDAARSASDERGNLCHGSMMPATRLW